MTLRLAPEGGLRRLVDGLWFGAGVFVALCGYGAYPEYPLLALFLVSTGGLSMHLHWPSRRDAP